MNHFIIAYAGNKRKEYQYFKSKVNLDNIENIIEPFAGSCAISFNIWLEYGDKFNYYLNDNCENIYDLYKLIRDEEPQDILNKLNEIKQTINGKEDYNKLFKKNFKNSKQRDKDNFNIFEYIVIHKGYSIRVGLFNEKRFNKDAKIKFNKLQLKFFEFLKSPNVFISLGDWSSIFDKFKDDDKSLIFLDPPYLQSCNDYYLDKTINIYEYLTKNNIDNFKSHIYLILEDNWIIKIIFNNNNAMMDYDKTYQQTKRKTTHILYKNNN